MRTVASKRLLLAVCALAACIGARAADKIVWKPVTDAQLKLDGRPVRSWNVYRVEKKNNLILVQLGRRYLRLDTKERTVYELQPSELEAHGKDFQTHESAGQRKLVPSSDWVDRDVGTAQLVRVKLQDYGHVLEVQLPHLPDLRGLY